MKSEKYFFEGKYLKENTHRRKRDHTYVCLRLHLCVFAIMLESEGKKGGMG